MRLLRPLVSCPKCGAPPRWRIPEPERARYAAEDPDTLVATYQCHSRTCNTIYRIEARAYQMAA